MNRLRSVTMDRQWRPLFPLIRIGLFGAVVLASYQLLYLGVQSYGVEWMGRENGPIESTQAALAALGSICLFWAARKSRIGRTGMTISAGLLGYAAARECDLLFEQWLFDDAYQWLIGLPLVVIIGSIVWRHRHQFVSDCAWLMRQPAAVMFGIAGIYLCTICQQLDRPDMWAEFSRIETFVHVKSMIEESCELFAYEVLAFAGIESAVLAQSRAARTGSEDGIVAAATAGDDAGGTLRAA